MYYTLCSFFSKEFWSRKGKRECRGGAKKRPIFEAKKDLKKKKKGLRVFGHIFINTIKLNPLWSSAEKLALLTM